MKYLFIVYALAFIFNASAQTTFNKRLQNQTDSISKYVFGWGIGVQYLNNNIYNLNQTWDSSGPSMVYFHQY